MDVFAQAGTGTVGTVPIAGQNQPTVLGNNDQATTTPSGQTMTTSSGPYQTTTSSDGTTQTTTSSY